MKKLCLPKGKKRNALTFALCVGLAVLLLALNLLLPLLLAKGAVYPDLTREGLYSLTDGFLAEVEKVEEDVDIVFLTDKDYLLGNYETRYVYIMCEKLAKKNERIHVKHLDLEKDPHAADEYLASKATTLKWNDVIVSSRGRYKVVNALSFFTQENDQYVSFNGEYRLATALLSVTRYPEGPYAYFAVGHGEDYYVEGDEGSDPSLSLFAEMLGDVGLRVGKLELDKIDAVPDDCVLLILCGTETDYADADVGDFYAPSAIAKIDEYLAKDKAMMVLQSAAASVLPTLNGYLAEWGFGFDGTTVTSPEDSLSSLGDTAGTRLIATYPDEESFGAGYALLGDLLTLATPPKTLLENATSLHTTWKKDTVTVAPNTTRHVSAVFLASDKAKVKDKNGYEVSLPSPVWLGAIASEAELKEGEYHYSYVFGAGSEALIRKDALADPSLGNGDIVFSLLRTIARTDTFASTEIGGFDMNMNYGGKLFDEVHLSDDTTNTVFFGLEYWREYKGMTTGAKVFMHIMVLAVPTVLVGLAAFYVLRRRQEPVLKSVPQMQGKPKAAESTKDKKSAQEKGKGKKHGKH